MVPLLERENYNIKISLQRLKSHSEHLIRFVIGNPRELWWWKNQNQKEKQ